VQAFLDDGEDFLQAATLPELVARMNALTGEELISAGELERTVRARDAEVRNPFSKDTQITALRGARNYLGDRLIRTAAPHRLLDPAAGPLIAVRLHVLLRKTLGGLETDLGGRVQRSAARSGAGALPGLYAAGEASGFGGGGMHGHNALEGTFLGGCLFTGRPAAAGGDLRLERGERAAQRRQVRAGAGAGIIARGVARRPRDRVDHQPGVLRDRVRGEVPAFGGALAAHERALHPGDERQTGAAEHVEGLLRGGAGRLAERERLPQPLRAHREGEVRQQLADGGLAPRLHG